MKSTKNDILFIISHLNCIFPQFIFKVGQRNGFFYLDLYKDDSFCKSGLVCEKSQKDFFKSLSIFRDSVNFTIDNKF